jgi:hypothetical protein
MQAVQTEPPPSTEVRTLADMKQAGIRWQLLHALSFFDYVRVDGRIGHPHSRLAGVFLVFDNELKHAGRVSAETATGGRAHPCSFELTCLVPPGFDPDRSAVAFQFLDGSLYVAGLEELRHEKSAERKRRAGGATADVAHNAFFEALKSERMGSVLEIGSRARSAISRRDLFGDLDYVGLDVLDGENVDVVGDAHELSALLPGRTFDAVFTVATFEHLLMPWKVALEINKVLRPGGILYVATHQSLGMHDLPCDYWRYSDTAWHGLFNARTGFEILATWLGDPMHLVPFEYHPHWKGCEGSAGFAASSMTCRKTGEAKLSWDVPLRDVAPGAYPE